MKPPTVFSPILFIISAFIPLFFICSAIGNIPGDLRLPVKLQFGSASDRVGIVDNFPVFSEGSGYSRGRDKLSIRFRRRINIGEWLCSGNFFTESLRTVFSKFPSTFTCSIPASRQILWRRGLIRSIWQTLSSSYKTNFAMPHSWYSTSEKAISRARSQRFYLSLI